MPTMTVQEWAAEYKLINEAEREDLKRRLPHEPVEESVRSYFDLCKLVLALSGSADEPEELQESRFKSHQALEETWMRLARRLQYAHRSSGSTDRS
jgi:hypothetical protein